MPKKHLTEKEYELAVKAYYTQRSYNSVSEALKITFRFAKKIVDEGYDGYPPIRETVQEYEEESAETGEKVSPVSTGIDPVVDRKFYLEAYKAIQRGTVEEMKKGEVPSINPKAVKGLVTLRELGKELIKESRKEFDVLALPYDDMSEAEINDLATGRRKVHK